LQGLRTDKIEWILQRECANSSSPIERWWNCGNWRASETTTGKGLYKLLVPHVLHAAYCEVSMSPFAYIIQELVQQECCRRKSSARLVASIESIPLLLCKGRTRATCWRLTNDDATDGHVTQSLSLPGTILHFYINTENPSFQYGYGRCESLEAYYPEVPL